MDKELMREDPDGWSRPATQTPHHVAVLPNEDIRSLFEKWMKEAREAPPVDKWKWWHNPTDYGFKNWELV